MDLTQRELNNIAREFEAKYHESIKSLKISNLRNMLNIGINIRLSEGESLDDVCLLAEIKRKYLSNESDCLPSEYYKIRVYYFV